MRYHNTAGRQKSRGRFLRYLILLAIGAGLLWVGLGWRVGSLVGQAEEALLQGDPATAAETLDKARFYRFSSGRVLEAEGLAALAAGDRDQAAALLERARLAGNSSTALNLGRVAAFLADQARYAALETLSAHRQQAGGAGVPPLWQAEAALAANRLDDAQRLLDTTGAAGGDRADRLKELTAQRRRDGRADILFDNKGRAIYSLSLEDGSPIIGAPELGAALTGPGGLLERLNEQDVQARIDLTLDMVFQRAAHAALGRYDGAFMAIEPRTGAILALVNHQSPDDDGMPAYRRQFEPGSIMKMLTMGAALENQIPTEESFPLNCTGNMTLDNQVFYDWTRHGTVKDIDVASAVSCNLTFAAIGLAMGQARLDDALRSFAFDRNLDLPDLEITTGRLLDMDPSRPRLGLARRSVGLDNVSITAAHAALLAASLANGGTMMQPYIVARRSALGATEPYAAAEPRVLLQPISAATAGTIGVAMEAVVTDKRGTGRRAALDGLPFAIKTGTAGEREPGLNTIVFGYAPVDEPQVAFAFIAEHAGKAELEGARIVRDFLSTVRNEFEPPR